MRKKDVQAYRTKTLGELGKEIRDIEKDLAMRQVDRYTKPSKNVREDKGKRIKIAVLKTLVREGCIEEKTV
jgi:ribosomal protein L29